MARRLLIALVAASALAACAPTGAAQAQEHPRIFLNATALRDVRGRARRDDPAWRALRARCDAYRTDTVQWPDGETYPSGGGIGAGYQGDGYYPALLDIGLCYQVARGIDPARATRYGAIGAAVLEHMSAVSGPHAPDTLRDSGYGVRYYAAGMAIGYDWLYPALDGALRGRVSTAIARWLGDYERAGFGHAFPQGNYFAGYYAAKAYADIALGDNGWLTRVHDRLVAPYYTANLAGGGWPEGWNYGPIGSVNMSLPVLAARTGLGVDLVHAPGHPYAYPVTNPRFVLYFSWPDMTTLEDSSALYDKDNPSVAAPWFWTTEAGLLSTLHDPFAPYFHRYARAARRAQPGGQLGDNWDLWENLLFWNDRAPERPYRTLPRSYHAHGIEMAAVRSDWSRHAVWGAFKAGPYINNPDNGEEYFDKGSLSIVNGRRPLLVNANGALLRNTPGTDDGSPFDEQIYDDVLGDARRRDIFNVFYAGATGQDNRTRRAGSRTHISHFGDQGSYVTMTGEQLADQYPRAVRAWTRSIVYVRPGIFVVADHTTADPSTDQRLAFHLGGRVAAGPASGGVRRYDVTGPAGYAGSVDSVLPAGHVEAVGALFGSSKVTRLQIRPGDHAATQTWLTVFDAAHSRAQAAAATPLRGTGITAGVALRRPGADLAVIFAAPHAPQIRYAPGTGAVTSIVTGLRPGATFTVRATTRGVQLRRGPGVRASAAGSIRFITHTTTRPGRTR
jgi:hypothetical protein